jgi:hypothetical protein
VNQLPTIVYQADQNNSHIDIDDVDDETRNGDSRESIERHLPSDDFPKNHPATYDLELEFSEHEMQSTNSALASSNIDQPLPSRCDEDVSDLASSAEGGNESVSVGPLTEVDSAEKGLNGPSTHNRQTTCTACSICIEDFVEGETLTLLPRCQHAFHKDCIMPWLTERSAMCPLCKTNVLDTESPLLVGNNDPSPTPSIGNR